MMSFQKADKNSLQQLINICCVCFNETAEEVLPMFNTYLSTDNCYVAAENGMVAANVYLIRCTINTPQGVVPGHYLYGAATLPQFRGTGVMHRLIEYATKQAKNDGDCFSALLPANSSLYKFYTGMGYKEFFSANTVNLKYDNIQPQKANICTFEDSLIDIMEQLRFNICKNRYGTLNWGYDVLSFATEQARSAMGGAVCCDKGYAIYFRESKDTVFVTEFMCQTKDFEYMAGVLKSSVTALNYKIRLPSRINVGKREKFGMIRTFNGYNPNISQGQYPYIGLTFD